MLLNIDLTQEDFITLRALSTALNDRLHVEFFPGFLESLAAFDEAYQIQNVSFENGTSHYAFDFAIAFKVSEDSNGEPRQLTVGVNGKINRNTGPGGKRIAEFGGSLEIPVSDGVSISGEMRFSSKMGDKYVVQLNVTQDVPSLGALFGLIAPDLASLIPEDFPLGGNAVAVIVPRTVTNPRHRFLLGMGLHTKPIDLGQMPLVGMYFRGGQGSADAAVELLAATHDFTHAELKALNSVLTGLEPPFMIRPSSGAQDLTRGAHLVAYAAFGDFRWTWHMPLRRSTGSSNPFLAGSGRVSGRAPRSSPDDALITVGHNGAWIDVQRAVGPLHIERLGVIYRDGAAEIVPEMVISVGPLRLLLNGATVRVPLSGGDSELRLDGFGLAYENDALRIGGAFLRSEGEKYEEYAGMAALELRIQAASLGLAAIGAYAHGEKEPSLFLYATLKYPLGGPPFFFVTGLSAGFGYGRSLDESKLGGDVSKFPLVAQAMDDTGNEETENPGVVIAGQLRDLARYIPITPDAGFLAIGVKFTSFKMLDGFALVTAELGDRFELGFMGLTRLEVPFGVKEPLVVLETSLQARFAPSEGVFLVRGQLTDSSYLLSPSCKLTGGFAVATWFAGKEAGDFVVTLGGYHPAFRVPKHYPTVPRIGFNLSLGSTLSLRAEAYMALCAHAAMAGGSFAADFEAGPAWASFRMGADFLISWKPYCYDVSLYVHFKFGLGPLSASLGAELRLWGPDLGGYAKLKVFLFSVKVRFGNREAFAPMPLTWDEFRPSLLPEDKEVCSIAVAEGLTRQAKTLTGEALWVVNPKDLVLTTDSVIPIREAYEDQAEKRALATGNAEFGVAPMGVKKDDLRSELSVSMWHDEQPLVGSDKFKITALHRKVPAAVWGEPQMNGDRLRFPDVNGTRFVEDTLSGLRIEPAKPPKGEVKAFVPVRPLLFEPEGTNPAHAFSFPALPAFRATGEEDGEVRRKQIQDSILRHAGRDALLVALGFDPAADVALDAGIAGTFVFAPQVKDTSAAR